MPTLKVTEAQVQEDIFDAIDRSIPPPLGDDEMTIDRYCKRFGRSRGKAQKILSEAVANGVLRVEERICPRKHGGGTVANVYIPVVK